MTVTSFTQALRERTWSGTDVQRAGADGAGFMTDLMTGKGTRDDYIALVAQNYFVYAALESAAEAMAGDPVAARFISPQLTRLPAIEHDLRFLLGDGWRASIVPLPTTARYVRRIDEVATSRWTGGFIAHHYTRYLGDLSGGRIIRSLMQRSFGFDTNGVGFYLFDQIAEPRAFKCTYRDQLDAADWSEQERDRVIAEVLVAYRFTTDLFVDLAAAKSYAA
ncbi:biliverdin-producing heme oxygenase [Marisediminicola senii]|uniref:biliverdin-producing heme oxygenase n=1 Tax=Marisediminicola senii TaxID=2711233 RepID=UPI0013EA9F45|nr:biliverdin-producing heme oxygenase [Marisediminicola senii]